MGATTSNPNDLIVLGPRGFHCPAGGFHIDPPAGVDTAVITHAHSDHAHPGSRRYIATWDCVPLLRARLGRVEVEALDYGEPIQLGRARVSLHSAGHILGSAQVRVEVDGEVWVHSGDYKRDDDPTCTPFEPVRCDTFITEATFGLPIYRWPAAEAVAARIHAWWAANRRRGRPSLLMSYSLGKAQRVLMALGDARPLHVHPQVEEINACYRAAGIALPPTVAVTEPDPATLAGELAVIPPGAAQSWLARLPDAAVAFASGWMAVRSRGKQRGGGEGFVLSDHADWPGLLRTVRETGARRVLVTHGEAAPLVRYLREVDGIDAAPLLPAAGG